MLVLQLAKCVSGGVNILIILKTFNLTDGYILSCVTEKDIFGNEQTS